MTQNEHLMLWRLKTHMVTKPDGTGRFDTNTRWTSLLQKKLGADHRVIEEGLCGRTTVFQG